MTSQQPQKKPRRSPDTPDRHRLLELISQLNSHEDGTGLATGSRAKDLGQHIPDWAQGIIREEVTEEMFKDIQQRLVQNRGRFFPGAPGVFSDAGEMMRYRRRHGKRVEFAPHVVRLDGGFVVKEYPARDCKKALKEALLTQFFAHMDEPNLLHGYHLFFWEERIFVVLEEAAMDLHEFQKLARPDAMFGGISDVMDGVQRLHDLGLLHRDIKLENIVYVAGRWKLIDFEYTQLVTAPLTRYCGTLHTMSHALIDAMRWNRRASELPVDMFVAADWHGVALSLLRFYNITHMCEDDKELAPDPIVELYHGVDAHRNAHRNATHVGDFCENLVRLLDESPVLPVEA